MNGIRTIIVAFSMFSAIPMPRAEWTPASMRYAMCAFPLVGAVTGGLCWGWYALCGLLGLPGMVQAAGLCLIPVAVTGGIHLDGFCDTCDALASHAQPWRKQEILKDPHIGAFAAIGLVCYLLLSFALCSSFQPDGKSLGALTFGFVLSRCLSGLAIASFPLAKDTGLAHTFAQASDQKTVRLVLSLFAIVLAAGAIFSCGAAGIGISAAAAVTFIYYRLRLISKFGGLSGDLAGWFLQICEIIMLAAVVLVQHLEGMI